MSARHRSWMRMRGRRRHLCGAARSLPSVDGGDGCWSVAIPVVVGVLVVRRSCGGGPHRHPSMVVVGPRRRSWMVVGARRLPCSWWWAFVTNGVGPSSPCGCGGHLSPFVDDGSGPRGHLWMVGGGLVGARCLPWVWW